MDSNIPEDILIVMIKRHGEVIIPNGSTNILPQDVLVVTGNNFDGLDDLLKCNNPNLSV